MIVTGLRVFLLTPLPWSIDSSASDTVPAQPAHASGLHPIYATTHGLRSIPYIVFVNTSMRDTCALHLSYVLANHSLPEQLLPYVPAAKAGPSTQQLEAYNTISDCQGIVYLPNDKLSSAGIKVLELSELAREGWLDELTQGEQSPSETPSKAVAYPRRISDAGFSPASGQAQGRRRSTVSSGSVDHGAYAGVGSYATNELDRARSRIQGNTLKECGSQSVELWSASLRMLSFARQILPVVRRKQSDGRNITHGDGSVDLTRARPTYASKLMIGPSIPGEPILAITGMSTHPTTPSVVQRRKGSSVTTSASKGRSPSLSSSLQASPLSVMINTSAEECLMPLGLPEALWQRILALASGAVGVVNNGQQESIIKWARDRDTLSREREALGKPERAQIWRVLEGMGCLAYEVRS